MNAFFEISGLNIYLQIIVTIVSIIIHFIRTRNKNRMESNIEIISLYTIGLAGWFSIMSGLFGHLIYADEVARTIGWPINSGFQMELAFSSIGIGIIGFLGFWKQSFWLPFIIAKSTFMWGAAGTHILHMIQENNFSPSNTGLIVYWDILLPILLIGLLVSFNRNHSKVKI